MVEDDKKLTASSMNNKVKKKKKDNQLGYNTIHYFSHQHQSCNLNTPGLR